MIERTLVLIKPDGVQRTLAGRIISRFEDAGLKIIGLKMKWADKEFAMKHYTEDLAKRRGEHVRKNMVEFISSGPVVAIALEGVNAIENVRKMTGEACGLTNILLQSIQPFLKFFRLCIMLRG